MKHSMKFYKQPFEKIASGKKTVEMRLRHKMIAACRTTEIVNE